jgi:hypothetical protein
MGLLAKKTNKTHKTQKNKYGGLRIFKQNYHPTNKINNMEKTRKQSMK